MKGKENDWYWFVNTVIDEEGNRRLIKTGDRMGENRTPVSDKLLAQQQPRQPPTNNNQHCRGSWQLRA